ncbi:unnamed protein product [Rhodiola kirilowii]
MASGSSGRVNSPSQGFDFGSDDVLCTYDDFNGQEGINGTNHTDSVIGAKANKQDFHKSRMTRSSFVPAPVYNQPEESLSQEVINAVERSMKKNSDNLMRFLEGISSRLSQLELYCYNVDKSVGEMRSELARDHGEVDSKLKTLEKHIGEVHRSVQILRDKQELAETHKELAKLQLAQKGSANSSQSQQNEERPPTPAMESQKVPDSSEVHNQHLALALPHQIPPPQPSLPPRTVEPARPVVHPAQAQPQNIPQQQHYYLPPTEMTAQAQPYQGQGQGQYAMPDTQYRQSQLQDMPRGPPQQVQSNVNQPPPPSHAHQFPQYQQQWPQQLPQQQLQTSSQPPMQPPNPTQLRPQPGPVYPTYQTSRPASPAPPDTIPSSMAMQYSGIPQPRTSRAEAMPYGYGGQPIQQQPPTQQMKGNFGAQANDGYTNMGSHLGHSPASGYMMYGNEEGRPHPPPPQPHFTQGVYPPAPPNPMARNPSQSQFARNHPYNDLVEKLVNMGFRGDHVLNVIQMMEEGGQPVDFNAVLDRLSAQSSGGSHRGWSG